LSPVSFLEEVENSFLLGAGSGAEPLAGPELYPFFADSADCSSQSSTLGSHRGSHPQRLMSF